MTNAARIAVSRQVVVRARPETIFGFFTDPMKFASWFGAGSFVEAVAGGALQVSFGGGAAGAAGTVVEVDPPRRIVFTWGYPGDDSPLPPGSSTVEITLEPSADGTIVRLVHSVPSDEMAQAHVAGWRHHLSHLATLAARGERPNASAVVDAWLEAWNESDDALRREALDRLCTADASLTDDLVTVSGTGEIAGHIDNARRHMPAVRLERIGPARVVADRLFFDWQMRHDDRGIVGSGTSVARSTLDGTLAEVVGCWRDDPEVVSARLAAAGGGGAAADADEHAPPLEPHLWARDLEAAVAWYGTALGFEVDARYPQDDSATWYRLVRGRAAVMVASVPKDTGGTQAYVAAVRDRLSHGGPIALYLVDAQVDAAHDAAVAAGARVIEPLWDPWWGGRQFTVEGPDAVWWTVTSGP